MAAGCIVIPAVTNESFDDFLATQIDISPAIANGPLKRLVQARLAIEARDVMEAYAAKDRREEEAKTVPQRLNRFRSCGLNADWSVSAWHFIGEEPNRGAGVYILDNEDDSWSVVFRNSEGGDDTIHQLRHFRDGCDLVAWLNTLGL